VLEHVLILLRKKNEKGDVLNLEASDFSEILRRLGRVEEIVTEIKNMLMQSTNIVSTSTLSREDIRTEQTNVFPTERLTESQLAILNEVRSSKVEVAAQDIQDRLGYRSRATVSHNLNDLFKLGLVNKRRGKKALYSTY